ncbi:MAG TPA: hypothetical protein GXX51_03430, partial [Firmicutes bacterium]|nr:hypothetical protein [Bacillota bacterium]
PLFKAKGDMIVKLPDSGEHQVDAYGDYERDGVKHLWVAECKYRKSEPMTAREVEKALEAAEVVREIRNARDMKVWLVSTGGFTRDALALIEKSGCLFSGLDEINEIARLYGIGVKIVEFV